MQEHLKDLNGQNSFGGVGTAGEKKKEMNYYPVSLYADAMSC